MLALSFLMLVGVALIGEGFDFHIPKGYIYFAMAFSVGGRDAQHPGAQERWQPDPVKLRKKLDDE